MEKELAIITEAFNGLHFPRCDNYMDWASPQHDKMLAILDEKMPFIQADIVNFGKHNSLDLDIMQIAEMAVLGPERALRQVLAEFDKSASALRQAEANTAEHTAEMRSLAEEVKDLEGIQRDIKLAQLAKKYIALHEGKKSLGGALRRCTAFAEMRDSLLKKLGIDKITEDVFEAAEFKYQIRRAFRQAIQSMESSGRIDPGNMEYLEMYGVTSRQAYDLINKELCLEDELVKEGKETWEARHDWYNEMANKFASMKKIILDRAGLTDCESAILKGEN